MAGEIIGPMSGDATAAFGSKRAAQFAYNEAAALEALVCQLVRP